MKNKNRIRFASLLAVMVILLSACAPKPEPTLPSDDPVFQTMVAGTLTAVANERELTLEATLKVPPTSTPTLTPPPTLTPTKEVVYVTVNENTNCRSGFSTYFPVVAVLKSGEKLEVIARSKKTDYFFVRSSGTDAPDCWVLDKYVTIQGNTEILPVFTSQPTPAPTVTPTPIPVPVFSFLYAGLNTCGADYSFHFQVENSGAVPMQSIRVRNYDNNTATEVIMTKNTFTSYSGCAVSVDQQDLTTGEVGTVTTYNPGQFNYDPTGHLITTTVTVCPENDLKGACTTKSFEFTP